MSGTSRRSRHNGNALVNDGNLPRNSKSVEDIMSYSREFIKDKVLKYDEYYGWENAIAVIYARWKITNSSTPMASRITTFRKN